MDLDLTPEQDLLRETVRGLCGRHAGLDVVRQLEDDPVGYSEKLWLQLGELGLLDVAANPQYRVDFDGAAAEALVGAGWAVFDDVMHEAIVALAAQAVGGARYALEITVQYAKDREQFDKPLGAFQAISHYLADAVTT